ncbi:hypothetical protein AAFF_G00227610 [Aldrovandia affinis]|uniref:Uncharacterized protein n=1 Tax=Aldrovandia affinis TaxID=143900 RepID=A0AAD7TCS9_9TELE|nr:hypothetical protein AAFF_G00227610 [Aldrovandia affinis]
MATKGAKEVNGRADEIWLLGKPIPRFPGTKLPSRGESLRLIFYLHKSDPELKKCIKQTAALISEVWDKAKIPTITPYRIIDKLTKLHQEYYGLRKSTNRSSGKAVEHREKFVMSLEDLFDVAHLDALSLVEIKEDKDFLIAQRRPGRPGSMLGVAGRWREREAPRD